MANFSADSLITFHLYAIVYAALIVWVSKLIRRILLFHAHMNWYKVHWGQGDIKHSKLLFVHSIFVGIMDFSGLLSRCPGKFCLRDCFWSINCCSILRCYLQGIKLKHTSGITLYLKGHKNRYDCASFSHMEDYILEETLILCFFPLFNLYQKLISWWMLFQTRCCSWNFLLPDVAVNVYLCVLQHFLGLLILSS